MVIAFPPSGKSRKLSHVEMFTLSALAPSMAVIFTNPFDVLKVRLQLNGETATRNVNTVSSKVYKNSLDCLIKTVRHEGILGLQKGLAPAIMRESSKNVFRLGMFEPIMSVFHPLTDPPTPAPGWKRLLAGSLCGAMGALSCNPFELVKTRLQSASQTDTIAVGSQHRYRGVMHGLSSIARNDGIRGLYRGSFLSVARSMLGSGSNLWAYSMGKEYLMVKHAWADDIYLDIVCGMGSGFVSVLCMNPVDVLRTRYYNQMYDSNGRGMIYTSGLDTLKKVVRSEGCTALYAGFTTHWFRSTHFCLTFVFLGMLRRGLLSHYDRQDTKEVFQSIDRNADGHIDPVEIVQALSEMIPREARLRGDADYSELIDGYVQRVLAKADPNHSGYISFQDFALFATEVRKILRERQIRESFEWFDKSKTGTLRADDLEIVIRESLPRHGSMSDQEYEKMVRMNVSGLMKHADVDGDGRISFAEFEKVVEKMDTVQKNRVLQNWMRLLVGQDD